MNRTDRRGLLPRLRRPGLGLLQHWRAARGRRRADHDWARALDAAVTPAHRAELLALRSAAPESCGTGDRR